MSYGRTEPWHGVNLIKIVRDHFERTTREESKKWKIDFYEISKTEFITSLFNRIVGRNITYRYEAYVPGFEFNI